MKLQSVFVDASHLDAGFQGTHTFICQLYKHLAILRPELKIYFGSYNPVALNEVLAGIRNKEIVGYKSSSRLKQGLSDVPNILEKLKPDFAHFQYVVPLGRKVCPYILTIHDTLIFSHPHLFSFKFRAPRKRLYRFSYKKSEVITTVSQYSKSGIEKFIGNSKKIWVTPNAVLPSDIAYSDKPAIKEILIQELGLKNRFILAVGRNEKRKNFDLLIRAYRELNLPDVDLVLVGSGVDKIEHEGVKKLVAVSPLNLRRLYQAADLFVFPSQAEGFGIPPLEAVNELCPVILSKGTALDEFDFLSRFQFDSSNIDQLKSKMLERLNEHEEKELVDIRYKMNLRYSWEKSASTLLDAMSQ